MKTQLLIASVLVLAIQPSAGAQGRLRDRIAARRAQQQQAGILNDDEPSGGKITLPAGVKVQRDISYGSDPLQKYDVYLPPNAQNAPVIFMVHGGGWRRGDKTSARVVQNKMSHWVPKGFVFISVDYPMLPGTSVQEQAGDVAKALAAAQSRAHEWHADPARFIVMGHSAGAHLVALLAASPMLRNNAGVRPYLGTISLDSAAVDVPAIMSERHARLYDDAFGADNSYWMAVSPIHQLKAGSAPILLVCSSKRQESCPHAHAFADKANPLGIRAEVLEEPLSHGQINMDLGQVGDYTSAVEMFMRSLDPALANMVTR